MVFAESLLSFDIQDWCSLILVDARHSELKRGSTQPTLNLNVSRWLRPHLVHLGKHYHIFLSRLEAFIAAHEQQQQNGQQEQNDNQQEQNDRHQQQNTNQQNTNQQNTNQQNTNQQDANQQQQNDNQHSKSIANYFQPKRIVGQPTNTNMN